MTHTTEVNILRSILEETQMNIIPNHDMWQTSNAITQKKLIMLRKDQPTSLPWKQKRRLSIHLVNGGILCGWNVCQTPIIMGVLHQYSFFANCTLTGQNWFRDTLKVRWEGNVWQQEKMDFVISSLGTLWKCLQFC